MPSQDEPFKWRRAFSLGWEASKLLPSLPVLLPGCSWRWVWEERLRSDFIAGPGGTETEDTGSMTPRYLGRRGWDASPSQHIEHRAGLGRK